MNILFYELKKTFKYKTIQLTLWVWVFAVSVFAFSTKYYVASSFELPIATLSNLSAITMVTLIMSMSSYIWGLEIDFKTFKILKTKNVASWKFVLIKLIVGAIYTFICFFIAFLIPTFIGFIFLPQGNINFEDINMVIKKKECLSFIISIYFKQWIASMFIIALTAFIALQTKNTILPVIITFLFVTLVGKMTGLIEMNFPTLLLPINSEYILREYKYGIVNQRIFSLIVYTIVLTIINAYLYQKKDTKI